MLNFVIALVIVVGGWWLIRQFANSKPARVRELIKKVAGGGIMIFAGLMAMRGQVQLAMPLFILGLGLMGQSMILPNGFPWQRKSAGQSSRVATSLLSMALDHDTGTMDGDVLSGPLKGRKLSSLTPPELQSFYQQCASAADQSRALYEAWLDRSRAGWREAWGNPERAGSGSGGKMSHKEALAVLGLKDGAGAEDIRSAHRRLMKDFHPDRGGSDYLAAKINAAKDVLLQDAGANT